MEQKTSEKKAERTNGSNGRSDGKDDKSKEKKLEEAGSSSAAEEEKKASEYTKLDDESIQTENHEWLD